MQEEVKCMDKLHSSDNNTIFLQKSKYLILWVIVISLGMFQFGFAMLIMNPFLGNLCNDNNYNCYGHTIFYKTAVTTAVPLGAFFGSILGGWLVKFGRRKILLFTNLLLTLSIVIIVSNRIIYILIVGRFFYGISVGIFS